MRIQLLPLSALVLTLACGLPLAIDCQQAVKPALPPATKAEHTAAPAIPAEALPQPTEFEKLQLENIQLKFSILTGQQQQLQTQYSSLIQKIVSEHPGTTWDAQQNRLIPAPKAAAEKK